MTRIPRTPDEMVEILSNSALLLIYGDITTAARRKRLTEHDIALIENRAISLIGEAVKTAQDFKTFEIEPAVAKAQHLCREFAAVSRAVRVKVITQEG